MQTPTTLLLTAHILFLTTVLSLLASRRGVMRVAMRCAVVVLAVMPALVVFGCDEAGVEKASEKAPAVGEQESDGPTPADPAAIKNAYQAYVAALDDLSASAITPKQLDEMARSETDEQLDRLAGDDAKLRRLLVAVREAYQQLDAVSLEIEKLKKTRDDLRVSRGDKSPAFQRVTSDLRVAEERFIIASQELHLREQAALNLYGFSTLRMYELEAIPPYRYGMRERRYQQLLKQHPHLAGKITAAYDAMVQYTLLAAEGRKPGWAVLEFRIAASPSDLEELKECFKQLDEQGPEPAEGDKLAWYPVDDVEEYIDDSRMYRAVLSWLDVLPGDEAFEENQQRVLTHFLGRGVIARGYAGRLFVLLHRDEAMAMTREQDWRVRSVALVEDDLNGPAITFELDGKGAKRMSRLSGTNIGKPMAVLIDNNVLTTPSIQTRLSNGVRITGAFTQAEADALKAAFGRAQNKP